jgi:hypothetical protein
MFRGRKLHTPQRIASGGKRRPVNDNKNWKDGNWAQEIQLHKWAVLIKNKTIGLFM